MTYLTDQPRPDDIATLEGAVVLDFGTNWCGICQAARADIAEGLAGTSLRHLKVEDGRGRPLGRSFGVKLWPTLVFLRDGKEITRVVRPTSAGEVARAAAELAAPSADA